MSTGTVAIPAEPTTAEQLAPGALSAYAAEMTPIYRRQAGLPDRQEWVTLAGIANALAASDMLPKGLQGRAKNVLAVILKGRDLGLSPTEAVWGIDMIEGMPTLKSHTMSALIKRAGHRLWYEDTSRDKATIVGQRLERWGSDGEPVYGPEIRLTWTIEDAIDAHLVQRESNGKLKALSKDGKKKPWMLYPAAMLRARALTAIARMEFSDVLMGAWYSPEELGAEVDADGKVIRLPQGQEAIAAFESLMERRPQHTGGDDDTTPREPDAVQSARPPESAIRDGEDLSGQLDRDVIDVQAEPVTPPTREELWAELEEQARVLAGGNVSRHTARAVAAYKANADAWEYEQLAEFVTGRRQSYFRHIDEHPDLAPATPEPWKAAAAPDSTGDPDVEPHHFEGDADACTRDGCGQLIDAGCHEVPHVATEQPVEPADEPAPAGTEPADDPAPDGTEPADTPTGEADVEDPPEGYDTLV